MTLYNYKFSAKTSENIEINVVSAFKNTKKFK